MLSSRPGEPLEALTGRWAVTEREASSLVAVAMGDVMGIADVDRT